MAAVVVQQLRDAVDLASPVVEDHALGEVAQLACELGEGVGDAWVRSVGEDPGVVEAGGAGAESLVELGELAQLDPDPDALLRDPGGQPGVVGEPGGGALACGAVGDVAGFELTEHVALGRVQETACVFESEGGVAQRLFIRARDVDRRHVRQRLDDPGHPMFAQLEHVYDPNDTL